MEPLNNAPVGVFDSGVGGLSVLRAIRSALPHEHLLYVADSRHAPYGDRDADFVTGRVDRIARFLLTRDAKAIVIACNTATVLAAAALRAWCPVPVVGIEPAIKPAALATKSGVVGVLATSHTVASAAVASLGARFGQGVHVVLQACPGLAEQVEHGRTHDPETRALLAHYLEPMLDEGADIVVLGCTHYAFLAEAVRALAGPWVQVIDPAPAVARELARRIADRCRGASSKPRPYTRFFSSALPAEVQPTISALWGSPVLVLPFDDDDAGAGAS